MPSFKTKITVTQQDLTKISEPKLVTHPNFQQRNVDQNYSDIPIVEFVHP